MGDILPFRPGGTGKPRATTLCRHGHHKWVVETASQFDVKEGRLVTRFRCERCGRVRTKAL